MATVINDFMPDPSRFHTHTMLARSDQQQPSTTEVQFLKSVHLPEEVPRSPRPQPTTTLIPTSTPPSSTDCAVPLGTPKNVEHAENDKNETFLIQTAPLSPPSSSSSVRARQRLTSQEKYVRGASLTAGLPQRPLDDIRTKHTSSPSLNSARTSTVVRSPASLDDVQNYGKKTIKIRDLAHIKSFALKELSCQGKSAPLMRENFTYEISGMPISDVIEMVAGLITKIITTNDRQHENLNSSSPSSPSHEETENNNERTPSVLAYHGKNVPSITILSYLSRIHKYCPTTYEVFLSLLVYFDRMTERINAAPMKTINREASEVEKKGTPQRTVEGSKICDNKDISSKSAAHISSGKESHPQKSSEIPTRQSQSRNEISLSRFFVVDSFNIHRLIIAGVTCASKFFSDVFYTNSRYAKVGGLPLAELNHLELQFLLLNDFRLSVSVEELDIYGTMLVNFYANEMLAQSQFSMLTETA